MRKIFIPLAINFFTLPAFAFVTLITPPGGQSAPNEGMVSTHTGLSGEERFNAAGSRNTCAQQDPLGVQILGGAGQNYDIADNSVALRRKLPDGDASCYLTLGSQFATESIQLEFSNASTTSPLVYLGFYWGSIDAYNSVTFQDVNNNKVSFFSDTGSYALAGDTAAGLLGVPLYSSNFVEFSFPAADMVKTIILSTGGYAFELDNIAYSLQPPLILLAVPEPDETSLALAGIGCLLLALTSRTRPTAENRPNDRP